MTFSTNNIEATNIQAGFFYGDGSFLTNVGATGATGPAGLNGLDGATGATGPQGEIGPTGPAGIATQTLSDTLLLGNTASTAILLQDGTSAAPSISFISDTDTGIYRPAANQLAFSLNNGIAGRFTDNGGVKTFTGEDGTLARPGIGFYADLDTGIYRPTTNQLAISTGGVQAALFSSTGINSTFTGDGSNITGINALNVSGYNITRRSADTAVDKTLVIGDAGNLIRVTGTVNKNITIPREADVNFPVGTLIEIINETTSSVTIISDPGSGGADSVWLRHNGMLSTGAAGSYLMYRRNQRVQLYKMFSSSGTNQGVWYVFDTANTDPTEYADGSATVTNINQSAYTNLIIPSTTIVGCQIGDMIEIEIFGSILNNSGGTRSYSHRFDFGGLQIVIAHGVGVATSATNRVPLRAKFIISINTSLTITQVFLEPGGSFAAGAVGGQAVTTRHGWNSNTSTFTGNRTFSYGMIADSTTATQQFRSHGWKMTRRRR